MCHKRKGLAALILIRGLAAATWYVSPAGSDTNPGTQQQPLLTISQAVNFATPGDTIVLEDGVYGAEGHTGFPVRISKGGTPSAWITVMAQNRGRAILDCGNALNGPQTGCSGYIYLDTGANYWVFQDLVFQNEYSVGISSNSTPAAHDILVRGCRFEYIGQHPDFTQYGEVGFYAGPGSYNLTFDSNVFHDIGRTSGTYISHDHGLYLYSSGTTIVNNIFRAPITGWGVQTANGFSGLIAYNTFALSMNNNGGLLMLWDQNSSVTIRNNIFYAPNLGFAINTSGLEISGGCSIDHNLVFGGAIGNVPLCSLTNNASGDPKFTNVLGTPYNFHLQFGSAAIDQGLPINGITYDFDGNPRPQTSATDVGAFQFVVTPRQPQVAPKKLPLPRP
jgi:hypothetical protein